MSRRQTFSAGKCRSAPDLAQSGCCLVENPSVLRRLFLGKEIGIAGGTGQDGTLALPNGAFQHPKIRPDGLRTDQLALAFLHLVILPNHPGRIDPGLHGRMAMGRKHLQ